MFPFISMSEKFCNHMLETGCIYKVIKFQVQTDNIQSIIKQISSHSVFHNLQKNNQLYWGPSRQLLEGTGLESQVPFLPNIASTFPIYPFPKIMITLMGKNLTAVIQKYLLTLWCPYALSFYYKILQLFSIGSEFANQYSQPLRKKYLKNTEPSLKWHGIQKTLNMSLSVFSTQKPSLKQMLKKPQTCNKRASTFFHLWLWFQMLLLW